MASQKNSGLDFNNDEVKREIKTRFDMLGYAQRRFPSVSKDSKGNYRIDGYQGLLIDPAQGLFYQHSTANGGDMLDFIGWCLFGETWDKHDPSMFKTVLEEGAKELGIYHLNSRPKSTVVAPHIRVVNPGLTWNYKVKGKNGEPTTLTHIHKYPNGNEKGRFEFINSKTKRPDKVCQWRHSTAQGRLETGKNGEPGLYNLEAALASDMETPILVVESEKEVELLARLGLPSICGPYGAGPDKWPVECNASLTGRSLILSPDRIDDEHPNDPGLAYCLEIYRNVYPVAKSVKLLEIDAHDITRWLNSGHTVEELKGRIANAPLATIEALAASVTTKSTGRPRPTVISAKDLAAKDFAPLEYIVPGILPAGTTLLAAKPKLGKSWLALGIAIAVAAGGVALSRPVKRAEALYLALEDNLPRLKRRLLKVCPQGIPDGLDFATDWARSDQGGMEDLETYIQEHPNLKFIAIDTLQKWRKPASGRDNIYNADYEALDGLTRMAGKYGIAVMIIAHTRKGTSEDPLEEVSGSNGLTGAVDNALVLRRDRGEADAVMHRIGRDLEDDSPLALKFDAMFATWTVIGDAEEHALSKERQEVYRLLKLNPAGLHPSEVAQALGKTRIAAQALLADMVEAKQVYQDGFRGKYKISNLSNFGNSSNLSNFGNSNLEGNSGATFQHNFEDEDSRVSEVTEVTGVTIPDGIGLAGRQIADIILLAETVADIDDLVKDAKTEIIDSVAYHKFVQFAERRKQQLRQ